MNVVITPYAQRGVRLYLRQEALVDILDTMALTRAERSVVEDLVENNKRAIEAHEKEQC